MPDLDFRVIGVSAAARGLTPLMQFRLRITHAPATEKIQAILLHAQLQLQPAQRSYTASEKERLLEMFGTPDRWGQTLRNRLLAHVDATVPAFVGETETLLSLPCTFDLNVEATKYFYALEDGDVSVLFLFSGTLFFTEADGRLQTQRISWNKESVYSFPVRKWRALMDQFYPNTAWIYLQRDVFERLYAYRQRAGLATWEQTVDHLLEAAHADAEVLI